MKKLFISRLLLVSLLVGVVSTGCKRTNTEESDAQTTLEEDLEWVIGVHKCLNLDSVGITSTTGFASSDTAQVNQTLKGLPQYENLNVIWAINPEDSTQLLLRAYEKEPLISERTHLSKMENAKKMDGSYHLDYKFTDTNKWAKIVKENVGSELLVTVDGIPCNSHTVAESDELCHIIIRFGEQ